MIRPNPLVVGILGAGRMAQGYDAPDSPHVLTLAHAVRTCDAFRLGGFFDVDGARAEAAERRWECGPSPRDREAWLNEPWDVILIATPDARHATDLKDALARKPLAILVEKPAATDEEEGLRLLEDAERLGVPVMVDFPRRWHSGVASVSRRIAEGVLGRPLAAVFAYSGDDAHSASHMLDLFHTWWSDAWTASIGSGPGGSSVRLRAAAHEVALSFVRLPSDAHYVWEMHVYCERAKVELSHSPEILELSLLAQHPRYSSFQVLTPRERFEMESEPLLSRAMDALAKAAGDPAAGRAALRREIDSLAFGAAVLRCRPRSVAGERAEVGGA